MLSPSLSLHAVVGRAGVVDAVRIAAGVVVMVVAQQQGQGQGQAAVVETAATHRVKRGRTRIRRDRGIMTESEDTIKKMGKAGGPSS